MNVIKKIIKLNFKIFRSYAEVTLNKTPYVLFMNILAKINRTGLKFGYEKDNYYVEENGETRFFIKSRGTYYANGVKKRTIDLIKSYNIDKIEFQVGDLIVDVGANMGDLMHYFPNQRYVGFEPAPKEFQALFKNKKSNCEVFNLCIGDEEKDITFYISSLGADSSIFQPTKVEEIIQVKQRRLDNLINGPIKLLKIDAEGAEQEVIRGANGLMSSIDFIAIDLGFEKGINQESTAPPVFQDLYSNNFKLVAIARNERFLFKNQIRL